jgi:hypothetical protein
MGRDMGGTMEHILQQGMREESGGDGQSSPQSCIYFDSNLSQLSIGLVRVYGSERSPQTISGPAIVFPNLEGSLLNCWSIWRAGLLLPEGV